MVDPLVMAVGGLGGYAIVSAVNGLALFFIPYIRHYLLIPVLFLAGIFVCLLSAIAFAYNQDQWVPYVLTTHVLNILQIIVLVGGSDRVMGKFRQYCSTNRNSASHSLRDL